MRRFEVDLCWWFYARDKNDERLLFGKLVYTVDQTNHKELYPHEADR